MKRFTITKRLKPAGGDLAIIGAVVILAVLIAVLLLTSTASRTRTLRILQNGELIEQVKLNDADGERFIEVDGSYHNTIVISGGEAGFVDSDCPNSDCVHRGMISKVGESAVCLPNRVVIEIVGSGSSADAVSG